MGFFKESAGRFGCFTRLIVGALMLVTLLPFPTLAQSASITASNGDITKQQRKAGGLLSSVVGIVGQSREKSGAPVNAWTGTGFLIDQCHVLTAAHVVMSPWGPHDVLWIGWGPKPLAPAGPVEAPSDLRAAFSNIVQAQPLWYGGSTQTSVAMAVTNRQIALIGELATSTGMHMAGDWAILTIAPCAPAGTPFFSMRKPPFSEDVPQASGTVYALGYPRGEFDAVTVTKCAVDLATSIALHMKCNIFGGNSGGPLVSDVQKGVAIGLTSYVSQGSATMISTDAASAALGLGVRPEPLPGCVPMLKRSLQAAADKAGKHEQWRPFDETINRPLMDAYLKLSYVVATRTGDAAAAIVPNRPDKIWCTAIAAYASKTEAGFAEASAYAGDWVRANGREGLRISADAQGARIVRTGDGVSSNKRLTHHWGYQQLIGAFHHRDGPTQESYWAVHFQPGQPPILVSTSYGNDLNVIYEPLIKGTINSACDKRRAELVRSREKGGGTSTRDEIAAFNREVDLFRCPGSVLGSSAAEERAMGTDTPLPALLARIVDSLGCRSNGFAQRAPGEWEFACSNRVGGVAKSTNGQILFGTCLRLSEGGLSGFEGTTGCSLPGNADPAKILTYTAQKLARSVYGPRPDCPFVKVRDAGTYMDQQRYEGVCADGRGYVLYLDPVSVGGGVQVGVCATNGGRDCILASSKL
jgi:V8-like Glu-specific endopeptidase